LLNYPAIGGICFAFIPPLLLMNDWFFKRQVKKKALKQQALSTAFDAGFEI
jgi:hypothetical protein